MAFEGRPLVVGQRVQGVGARQAVQVLGAHHALTPRQSRSRMRPSRSRVLTVPSGSASRLGDLPVGQAAVVGTG